jgi:hypothetical protein
MPLHGIAMNVISMMNVINFISNSMIGEASLPDFGIASDDASEFVRASALDQLDATFDGYVVRGCEEQMNVFGHNDEAVQFVTSLAAMPINRFQEESNIIFDDKQFPAMIGRERDEISSSWREESYGLQEQTSAAESRPSPETLTWHEWNSCPSRLFFAQEFSFWERTNVQ